MKSDGGPIFPKLIQSTFSRDEEGVPDAMIYKSTPGLSKLELFTLGAMMMGCPHNGYNHEECVAWACERAEEQLAELDRRQKDS